jgi:hypothetical protein
LDTPGEHWRWTAVFLFVGLVGTLIGGLFVLFAGVRSGLLEIPLWSFEYLVAL